MDSDRKPFYITGGTLASDASSYVRRSADTEMFDCLQAGELCYVLDTRQMGKSSLMVRVAARLKALGVRTVMLDLTALGQNVTVEQWYLGLLSHLGEQTNLLEELLDGWRGRRELGALQRFLVGLRLVLEQLPDAKIVLFFDEVDAVRSLPFSTDELFAAIRECYNHRAHDPLFARLTFCLLGVAAPADLIRDTRSTPFNIGTRIVLADFTPEEAELLGNGLSGRSPFHVRRILQRILRWTGGHPYLTQRLCREVARWGLGNPASPLPNSEVDRLCRGLFLDKAAQETNDNLAFVRNRLLEGDEDRASLLDLYRQVRAGKRVKDDDANPLCAVLRLSGIVRVVGGCLKVRNRIYNQVFDMHWIRANMPGAELRRQQAAYRAGAMRTAGFAAAIIAIVGVLAILNLRTAHRAQRAELRVAAEADYAYRLLYDADLNLAQEMYQKDSKEPIEEMLQETRPPPGKQDLRGFEWYYLHRLCHQEAALFTGHRGSVTSLALAPDGRTLASGSRDNTVRLWDLPAGRQRLCLKSPYGMTTSVSFSPHGDQVACGCDHKQILVWDVQSGRCLHVLHGHAGPVTSVAFSHDGRLLASGSNDGTVRLWDTGTWKSLAVLPLHHLRGVWAVAFSPDDTLLATGGDDGVTRLWNVATRQPIRSLIGHEWYVYALAFAPDGKTLATAGGDKTAMLWDVATGTRLHSLRAHTSYLYCTAFSHDGKHLATGGWDGAVRLWNVETGREERTINHIDDIWAVAFSVDDHTLLCGGSSSPIRVFDLKQLPEGRNLTGLHKAVVQVAFDGERIAATDHDGQTGFWNPEAHSPATLLPPPLRTAPALRSDGCLDMQSLYASSEWKAFLKAAPFAHTGFSNREAEPSHFPEDRQRDMTLFWSEDHRLVGVCARGAISLIDVTTGRVVWQQPASGDYRLCALAPDAKTLIAVDAHNHLTCFDLIAARTCFTLTNLPGAVDFLCYMPDSRAFLMSEGSLARIRDVQEGRVRKTFDDHRYKMCAAAISHDGRRIAIGNIDATVKLWDVVTGRVLLTLQAENPVISVAFSADGRRILSGSTFGSVRLWDSMPLPTTVLGNELPR